MGTVHCQPWRTEWFLAGPFTPNAWRCLMEIAHVDANFSLPFLYTLSFHLQVRWSKCCHRKEGPQNSFGLQISFFFFLFIRCLTITWSLSALLLWGIVCHWPDIVLSCWLNIYSPLWKSCQETLLTLNWNLLQRLTYIMLNLGYLWERFLKSFKEKKWANEGLWSLLYWS